MVKNVVFGIIALVVVTLDQLTKLWVSSQLDLYQSMWQIGIFRLTLVHNTGASFGLFQNQTAALAVTSLIGVAAVLLYFFVLQRHYGLNHRLGTVALGLILGGTIGNLIDRIRLHYVVDFIDFTYWPSFNVADSSVVVGTILFAITVLFFTSNTKKSGN